MWSKMEPEMKEKLSGKGRIMLKDTIRPDETEIKPEVVSKMSRFSISHIRQLALYYSPACPPPPTRLHPFIKKPNGTRKLIVRTGILPPCAAYPTC